MTHKHPLQHPAHKSTPPRTSPCCRAQLGPGRGTRSPPHARREPRTSPASPSRCLWHPSRGEAGNSRMKQDKDITITFKPQNTVFVCLFFFLGVLWTTHESKSALLRQCLWKHFSWERTWTAHHNQAEIFQATSTVFSPNSPFLPTDTE